MKFGRNLPRNQVPEWEANYINYKVLKKLIKAAMTITKAGNDADLAEFFFSLDRNLEDVDDFYNKKYAYVSRRLKLLQERYDTSKHATESMDQNEIDEVISALLELRGNLRKLQWFGEVNRRGFVKITKKLDKRVLNICAQQRYLVSKVNQKPFSTDFQLLAKMAEINDWLSVLGEAKSMDDTRSIHSIHSVKRVSSRSSLNLSSRILDTVDQAIKNDDVQVLNESLSEAKIEPDSPEMQELLLNLLQRAISCRSRQSIKLFLASLKSLDEPEDINQRNCLHRLVISIGRAKSATEESQRTGMMPSVESAEEMNFLIPASSPSLGPVQTKLKESNLLSFDDEYVKLLVYVLDSLEPHQRYALKAQDNYGRFPLHYAAKLGCVVICQLIMKYMQEWGQFKLENGIDAPEWQDKEGLAPLHFSVIGGYPLTTQALVTGEDWRGHNGAAAVMRRNISKSSTVLALATKSNFKSIVQLLVDAGVDINWQDKMGETALHIAARFGHKDCAEILLHGTLDQKADVEIIENTFSWTPLHIAAVDGHLSIVELLLEYGADPNGLDASGWTAKEHAALRGHMDIARNLATASALPEAEDSGTEDSKSPVPSSPPDLSSMEASCSQIATPSTIEPVKSFGHRYMTNESLVLVSLGSMDMRKNIPAVKLDKIPIAQAHSTQLDTALSVIVSAQGAQGESVTFDLPIQDHISTEPIVFTAVDATKVKLYFDIVPTYSGSQEHKVGRGVAVLSSIKQAISTKRMSLQGDVSVPILSTDLEVIGTVNFNFLIITPFSHPKMSINTKQTYWKEMSSTMVIGHRGLGKNMTSNKSLQLGENTLQSFIAAANLGANYVEFDVQLTKDHVPVIYHDFLVSETGIDAPVHTLTLEQFLHVNHTRPHISRSPSPSRNVANSNVKVVRGMDRQRSQSLTHMTAPEYDMAERMKHTRDFKAKGYKANSRGNFIQAPFTTLEEMFLKLPENVGFNIEMKYPMLHESEAHEMDAYAVELNSFVDTVLTKVYDLGKKRKIIFSSFNPDICLLLSFKQPSIPILFLTDAGTNPVGDIRASSLQEAIRFASRWNLLGVVSAAEPLCNSPRLVKLVKENGLVCVSYGTLNNDPAKVQQQVNEGIDAVIVDSVLKIRNGLTKNAAIATVPAVA